MTTTILDWASDGVYAALGDAYDGLANAIAPTAGQITQGGRPKKQLPAQFYNWALQQLASREKLTVLSVVTYTAVGAFSDTPPPGATIAIVPGVGGGGGGGGGAGNGSTTAKSASGGGGGGGAPLSTQMIPVVAGTPIAGVVGAGGTGGAAGAVSGNGIVGALGTASSFGTCTFPGGGGGCAGIYNASASIFTLSPGGSPTLVAGSALVCATGGFIPQASIGILFCRCPGEGGYSQNDTTATSPGHSANGVMSASGFAGGVKGANGIGTAGPYVAGSGGGGGGGGGCGAGGNGGVGSDGGTGAGVPGGNGVSAAANTGGGGGGGGGTGPSSGTNIGSTGGDGGSGKVIIIYLGCPPP